MFACVLFVNLNSKLLLHFDVAWNIHNLRFDYIIQGDVLYMFFETKNSITMQGDIGVARSTDKGASWEQLGIALDEGWHLSYPYVFDYNGNVSS